MNKRTLALGLLFMIGAVVQVGAHHDIRDTPAKWCGAGAPYTGTLWIWADYGLPFSWLEVGTWESCTTTVKGYARINPDGLVLNLIMFGVLAYFLNRGREKEERDISKIEAWYSRKGGRPPY